MRRQRLSLVSAAEVYDFLHIWSSACGPFCYGPLRSPKLSNGILPLDHAFEFYPMLDKVRSELLSKARITKGPDSRDNAIAKYKAVQAQNAIHSRYFREMLGCNGSPITSRLLKTVRKRISIMLGPLNESVLKEFATLCYLGPGISQGTKKHDEHSRINARTITRELLPFGLSLLNESGLSRFLIESDGPCSVLDAMFCVEDARLTTVPKRSDCDRTITVEPSINSLLQNGIGEYLRRRLKRYRFHDLTDQGHNQRLAHYPNATIDLSSASDTITREMVKLVLPPDWFHLLDITRSPRVTVDGEVHEFDGFIGMGNGFCFPLETIIFSAIAYAASGNIAPLAVYGDDIIVSYKHATCVIDLLQSFGFKVNHDKSHWTLDDPYRESCGVHRYYQSSVPVVYFKPESSDPSIAIISLHNRVLELVHDYDTNVNQFLGILRRMVPTVGVAPPGLNGIYFHSRSRRMPLSVVIISKTSVPLKYKDTTQGFNLALYHKILRGSSAARDTRETFVNRDSRELIRTNRLNLLKKVRKIETWRSY